MIVREPEDSMNSPGDSRCVECVGNKEIVRSVF